MLNFEPYNLKDFEIFNNPKSFDFSVWIPDKTYVVLGRSNTLEQSVNINNVVRDNISVLKRPSGGEAVILSPKTIVISLKFNISDVLTTHLYFRKINQKIIDALRSVDVKDLKMKGISDISIGVKKILGSSIYRKNNTVFYHAVLNVSESSDTLETYLSYPKREPDYRQGRKHKNFVTSLFHESYNIDISKIISALKLNLVKLDKKLELYSQANI